MSWFDRRGRHAGAWIERIIDIAVLPLKRRRPSMKRFASRSCKLDARTDTYRTAIDPLGQVS